MWLSQLAFPDSFPGMWSPCFSVPWDTVQHGRLQMHSRATSSALRLQFSALSHFWSICISGFTNFWGFIGQHDAEYSDFEHQELPFPWEKFGGQGSAGRLELKDQQSLLGSSEGRIRAAVPACWRLAGVSLSLKVESPSPQLLDGNPWHQALGHSRKGTLAPSVLPGTSYITAASADTAGQVPPLFCEHPHHQLCSPTVQAICISWCKRGSMSKTGHGVCLARQHSCSFKSVNQSTL